MRIGIAYFEHGSDRGIERISDETALALARAGHEVHYHCYRHGKSREPGVTFHALRIPSAVNSIQLVHFAFAASRELNRGRYDLTHSFGNVVGCDLISAQSCHRAGMEAAEQTHGTSFREGRSFGVADRIRLVLERQNYGARRYRRIVACSSRVRRELSRHYGVPDKDVVIIPNGVDLEAFHPGRRRTAGTALRNRLGLPEGQFVLLFVGHEFMRKGLDTVIEALARLGDPGIRLVVCGEGDERLHRRFAERLGIVERVMFTGHVADIAPYYSMADLFVLPSLYEPFGLVITEAMASGVPVLVSASAGAAEDLIIDHRNGLLIQNPRDPVELSEKIRLLKENPTLRSSLAVAGRTKVESTGWDSFGRSLLGVCDAVRAEKILSRQV